MYVLRRQTSSWKEFENINHWRSVFQLRCPRIFLWWAEDNVSSLRIHYYSHPLLYVIFMQYTTIPRTIDLFCIVVRQHQNVTEYVQIYIPLFSYNNLMLLDAAWRCLTYLYLVMAQKNCIGMKLNIIDQIEIIG